jgi:hypothetical protein
MERAKIQRKENADHEHSVINSSLMQQPANINSAQATETQISENLEPQYAHNFADISVFAPGHTVQRKAAPKTTDATEPDLNSRIQASAGSGIPLEQNIQTQLETGIGADLSGVRVHTDSEANKLSHELHANAFTTGNDIYFRQGLYNPTSSDGMRLLAHETTHTVQQANGAVDGVSWGGGVKVSDPNDRFEQAAEATANNFVNSSPVGVAPTGGSSNAGVVQREAVVEEEEKDKLEKPKPEEELQLERDSSSVNLSIQRDPTPAAATPPASPTPTSAPVVWKPPFDLPQASKKYEAGIRLLAVSQQLDELQESMGDLDHSQVEGANKGIKALLEPMRSEDALTQDDVNKLEIASGFAKTAADSGRQAISGLISTALAQISIADTSDMDNLQENLDEEMRKAFLQGTDTSRISQIKSAIGAIKEYKGHAEKVAGWATKANILLKSTKLKEFLEAFGKRSKQLDTGLKYVGNVLDAAKFIDGLLGDQGPGQSSNDIAKFETSIKGIDFAMGFASAVPGLGQLWTYYYKPLTEACIKHLKYILRLQDEQKRDLTMVGWMTDEKKGRGPGGVPIIPPSLMSAFPGGQSVLNYMYLLVNGGAATMTPEVETFFVTHKDLFNAGAEKKDEIDTEWHFFRKTTSPNLVNWIPRNVNTVWAMLYGNMQKNI